MNYYTPNYYAMGYPYNQYPQFQQPQQQFQMSQMNNNQQQAPQTPGLNGKIVDSEDVVRATEVPIGGYGIFPKADLSEIYIKSWNNNGTTSVIAYKPVFPDPQQQASGGGNGEIINILLQKIEALESKLDMFLTPAAAAPKAPVPQSAQKKVEVF